MLLCCWHFRWISLLLTSKINWLTRYRLGFVLAMLSLPDALLGRSVGRLWIPCARMFLWNLRFLSWLLILRVSCKLPGLLPNGLGDTSDPCENRPHWSEKTKSAGKSIHMAVAGVRRSTKAFNALLIRCIFWRKMMLRTIIHQKLVKVHLLSLISQLFAAESFDFDGSWYGYGSIPINTY